MTNASQCNEISAVGIGHFRPVVTNDQTRQLVISKDHIGMRFSSSFIRINFKDEITTFNPYIAINSNHNHMFKNTCILLFSYFHSAMYKKCLIKQADK